MAVFVWGGEGGRANASKFDRMYFTFGVNHDAPYLTNSLVSELVTQDLET